MKFRTSKKFIMESGEKVYSTGYCEMQNLLHYEEPIAYTSGVYGWNYDVYKVDGIIICTGYRGMPGQRLDVDKVREAEEKAEKLIYNHKAININNFQKLKDKLAKLRKELY